MTSSASLVEKLRKEYHLTGDSDIQRRWLKEFDILYRENEVQAVLLSQTMTCQDHQDYMDYNQNDKYDDRELDTQGIGHLTIKDLNKLYNLNLKNGFLNFTNPPTSLQLLYNHACRMGNTSLVALYIQHNHNNYQTRLIIKAGLILATIQNHYDTVKYILVYLMDDFDEYTIQMIFLANNSGNFNLVDKLLERSLNIGSYTRFRQHYMMLAIDQNALFLLDHMLKYWYNYRHPSLDINIYDIYEHAVRSNKIEIIEYLEREYTSDRELNDEEYNMDAIYKQSSDPKKLLQVTQELTCKHRPASTLSFIMREICCSMIPVAIGCTSWILCNMLVNVEMNEILNANEGNYQLL
jgi:hypothetical protein